MKPTTFTVFEHASLIEGQQYGGMQFESSHRALLEGAFRENNFPFYSLIRRGIRFCEYVGVFRVGNLQIEVLPKAAKSDDTELWRTRLIDMLRYAGAVDIDTPSSSMLKLKSGSVLDLYCMLFLDETERLVHQGLIRKYQQTAGNSTSLKGAICFAQHLRENLTHQERFFVRHTTYTYEHAMNAVLYTTICMLQRVSINPALRSRIGALQLHWPPMEPVQVSEAWFSRLHFDRKSDPYRRALSIAKLLLLNYHPDISTGRNDVLAIMFDMNILWEKFVCRALQRFLGKHQPSWTVHAQAKRLFWKNPSRGGSAVTMKPDLVIDRGRDMIVLDSKWKNLSQGLSPHDLRQMYAYSKFHNNAETVLVYPGSATLFTLGYFMDGVKDRLPVRGQACRLLEVSVEGEFGEWRDRLGTQILQMSCSKIG